MTGTARIDLRLEPEQLALIKAGAALEHRSVTSYMVRLGVTYSQTLMNQNTAEAPQPELAETSQRPDPKPPKPDRAIPEHLRRYGMDFSLDYDSFCDEMHRRKLSDPVKDEHIEHWYEINT